MMPRVQYLGLLDHKGQLLPQTFANPRRDLEALQKAFLVARNNPKVRDVVLIRTLREDDQATHEWQESEGRYIVRATGTTKEYAPTPDEYRRACDMAQAVVNATKKPCRVFFRMPHAQVVPKPQHTAAPVEISVVQITHTSYGEDVS